MKLYKEAHSNRQKEDSPGGSVVKTLCFQWREGAQVGSLVRELRYHMPQGVAKKKKRHESSFFILFACPTVTHPKY